MTPANGRVNELDLLRFLAAISVVLFHYSFRGYAADALSALPYPDLSVVARYGYLGVHLFFLISGFVILMSAADGNLKNFIISRTVRLYPAFWVCCTITFVLIATIGSPRLTASLSQYLLNMTLMSNALGVPPIDGVYWSLFVEIKFYMLVAVILAFGLIRQAEWILVAWLVATVALTALPIGILRSLLLSDYSPYFIGGAMSYLVWSKGASLLRSGTLLTAWIVALYQSLRELTEFDAHYHTQLNIYVVIAIITGFFLVMHLVAHRRSGLLGRQQWQTIGALTYPLYLLHQNIGYMLFNVGYPQLNPHLLFWGTVGLMLFMAYSVNVLIERRLAFRLKAFLRTVLNAHPKTSPSPSPSS